MREVINYYENITGYTHEIHNIPNFNYSKNGLNDQIIWAIFEDSNKDLWIGTHRNGINLWNRSKDSYYYFSELDGLPDSHIRSFEEDYRGNIWIGTYSGGLSLYNRSNGKFINFVNDENDNNSLGGNQVQSLFIENDTILWLGTFGGGLNKLNIKNY